MTGSRGSSLRITISDADQPDDRRDGGLRNAAHLGTPGGSDTRPQAPNARAARVAVMTLRGNLDIDSSQRLRAALSGVLGSGGTRMVVDLSGLDFCDSVGLSALVDAHRACARSGGYFRLAAPSAFLSRILAVVGLIGRLAVYESVAAALADEPPGGIPSPASAEPTR